MTDTSLLALRPMRSPSTRIGPAMRIGGKPMHYVKNGATASYYRLGVRETYLLALMDGVRTLDDIATAYQRTFGAALTPAGMGRILQILGSRGLLAMPDAAAISMPAAATAPALPRLSVKGWGEVYLRVADPGRLLDVIVARLAWVRGRFAIPCIAAVVGLCELYALCHHGALWQAIQASLRQPSGPLIAVFCAITYASAVVHELAHGTMCVRYGGRVNDMGLMFRYLMLFPYCKLDDLVILPGARARIVTVLAGVTVNLLLLLPFVVLDSWLDGDGFLKQLCAYMLVFYNASVLFNLVPYLRFDGYMLVSIGRGRPELKEEAFALLRRFGRMTQETAQGSVAGTAPDWPLLAYGLSYALVTAAAVGAALFQWLRWSMRAGMPWLCVLPLLLLGVLYVKAGKARAGARPVPVKP